MACRSGENVLCNVWLSIGDFACLETASYNGLQMAWVSTTVDAVVVVEAVGPGLVFTLETSPPDGVGGAGGVGTDGCKMSTWLDLSIYKTNDPQPLILPFSVQCRKSQVYQ